MSEKNDRPKPPPRRTGRPLGGAKKGTPPPPPTAELTPEQIATEQAVHQGGLRPAAVSEPQVQPTSSTDPAEEATQDHTEAMPEAASVQPTLEVAPNAPAHATDVSHLAQPAVDSPGPRLDPDAGKPIESRVPPVGPTSRPLAPAGTTVTPPQAEVVIRPTGAPTAGTTAFPVRTDSSVPRPEQPVHPETAPSQGTPWAHGPGRPKDIPETAVVLNQRIITRESLDSSVPAALRLKRRIKRFALDNELDHLPLGDIVAVAMDEWLTTRGF